MTAGAVHLVQGKLIFSNLKKEVNAVVLSGGSAYGLAAGCGVMEYLKDHNIGYKTQGKVVPIVSQAVIYDLNQKDYHYPTAEYGY